jgi:Ni,Fe-hydrogenase III large subunit
MSQLYSEISNDFSAPGIDRIPVLEYGVFYDLAAELLKDETNHCAAYYGYEISGNLRCVCCIADDKNNNVKVFAYELNRKNPVVKSLTPVCPQLHIFEREIHENHGVEFEGHPWLKPVRYPFNRQKQSETIDKYPFYEIDSEELHEVGVGPIHAGVIEPGHFRFICNGEKVLHLEIQLGYQHRGLEKLFIERQNQLQRCILSENIAGDTSVGHSLAHIQLVESMAGIETGDALKIERCIALELERIAIHTGDTAALCGDVAYQLGQVVCEAVRTSIINAVQNWCGNRFGKGLIRPGGSNYPLNDKITAQILKALDETCRKFSEIADRIYSLPSLLARFEDIGQITKQQALTIGAVGMAARTSGISRDIRSSHPFQFYKNYPVKADILETGDVLARGKIRVMEVMESVKIIRELIEIRQKITEHHNKPVYDYSLKPNSFALSMVEGWRGEICHSAMTDNNGDMVHYKVKDPSFHNWMALALAVRNQEISDFPVCNKSFNLSYCGNDL